MRRTIKFAFGILMMTASAAWSAESVTPAPVASGRSRAVHTGGSVVSLELTIDLAALSAGRTISSLGGYAFNVEFDPTAVEVLSVSGGRDPLFSSSPFATNTAKANASGQLKVVGVQANPYGPSGTVSVAQVRFVEKRPGGAATIVVHLQEAVSSVQQRSDGSAGLMRFPVATPVSN